MKKELEQIIKKYNQLITESPVSGTESTASDLEKIASLLAGPFYEDIHFLLIKSGSEEGFNDLLSEARDAHSKGFTFGINGENWLVQKGAYVFSKSKIKSPKDISRFLLKDPSVLTDDELLLIEIYLAGHGPFSIFNSAISYLNIK